MKLKSKVKKTKIICDECKHEFFLGSVGINEAIVELNGVPVTLVYFACPRCDKIYRISIQDKRYDELVEDLEKTKKRLRKSFNKNNVEKAEMLSSMVFKKKERLASYVQAVNKMFPGTFTFVTSENNNKERKIKYLPWENIHGNLGGN